MASASLPSPGHLILENVTLLAGSPTAFHSRYGFTLTPTTFAKPGNNTCAHAILHFLISIIDADVAESLFKPCYPILDRDQERDFRKLVDSRLSILERTRLLPPGTARKSVVSAAGGDKFTDLLWSLSSLAVQQACLRHPAYASVSRLRLASHQTQPDVDSRSEASTARSSRGRLASFSSRTERSASDASRHRRFLGVGMLSASQQRSKEAEEMRARIDSERIALLRTTEMGHHGAHTWASEADSLREKIGQFEANLRRLKKQLADMGFDENGVDIRPKSSPADGSDDADEGNPDNNKQKLNHDEAVTGEMKPGVDPGATGGPLVPSPSDEELKTSPIESTESCSSVDDACDDLASDLSRLLTFTMVTRETRDEIDRAFDAEKRPTFPSVGTVPANTDSSNEDLGKVPTDNPQDILHLVRAATDQLERVTNRMHEIREARERAEIEAGAEVETDVDGTPSEDGQKESSFTEPASPPEVAEKAEVTLNREEEDPSKVPEDEEQMLASYHALANCESVAPPSPNVEKVSCCTELPSPLEETVTKALEEHSVVVESSRRLQKDAAELSAKAVSQSEPLPTDDGKEVTVSEPVDQQALNPHWYANVTSRAGRKKSSSSSGSKKHRKPPRPETNSNADVGNALRALQGHSPPQNSSSRPARSRNRKEGSRSMDNITLSTDVSTRASFNDVSPTLPASSNPMKLTPRSVRFAELPPSYSASRSFDGCVGRSSVANSHCRDEKFPESARQTSSEVEDTSREVPDSPIGTQDVVADSLKNTAPVEDEITAAKPGSMSRRDSKSGRRNEKPRRAEAPAVDAGRNGGVSAQRPPRIQRTQTPRRVTRRNSDASPRPTPSRMQRSYGARAARSFTSRSINANSTRPFEKTAPKSSTSEVKRGKAEEDSEGTEQKEARPQACGSAENHDIIEEANRGSVCAVAPCESNDNGDSLEEQNDVTVEGAVESGESVQKKLFSTPESAVSSSKLSRQDSVPNVPKQNEEGLSNVNGSPSHLTALVKSSSAEFPLADDQELLFSPVVKPPLPKKAPETSVPNKGGFFAGQAAQWQQSVRSRSNADGQFTALSAARASTESSGRLGRNSGKTSGMKGRVQSLRARLAALK